MRHPAGGDDYMMLDPARDTRQKRALSGRSATHTHAVD
jgi:hypothetical protein